MTIALESAAGSPKKLLPTRSHLPAGSFSRLGEERNSVRLSAPPAVLSIAASILWALSRFYLVSLFGFVIWVGLLISWLFFSGIKPPLAS
jgi:hypothetical protein